MKRIAVLAIVAALFAMVARQYPYGEWDAWARWNAMARQLHYHDPVALIRELAPFTEHLEYPPLLYIGQAGLIALFGDTPLVAIALHGAILLVITALMRPWWLALIVGMACVYFAVLQCADLPLALCFLLAAMAYKQKREAWAGLALGIASLVKNEGLLILVVFMALWTIRERRIVWRAWAGTAIPLLLLVLWKLAIPQSNDVLGSSGIMDRVTQWERYSIVIPYVIDGIFQFSTGAILIVVLLAVLRGRPDVDWLLLAVVGVIWLGYVAIYIITPHDVIWHLSTSYDRLLAQLFPVFAFALIRETKTPLIP